MISGTPGTARPPGTPGHPGYLDPLPREYLTDGEGIGGAIKQRPEDFLVDELPLYEPSGEGEHLYLGIEKRGVSHGELMSCLRRTFNVSDNEIGFAGMKDKVGVTRQMVSIHTAESPGRIDLGHERIHVLWAMRHRNKIRRGHLKGNRFSIRIREVDPIRAPAVARCMRRLEREGVPNYFGFQRFGYRHNNQLLGAAYLRGHWRGLIDELLSTRGSPFPEYQRERRELYEADQFAEAAERWTPADRAERSVCRALAAGRDDRGAALACGRATLAFWVSALQSAIFNRVLDQRLREGLLLTLIEGDLAWKHDSRAVFPVTAEELAKGELARRVEALELSPSGPLWGRRMTQASGGVLAREIEALEASGLTLEQLTQSRDALEGARRLLRVPLRHPEIDSGVDEHGPYIRVAFDLPRGAYATVALREVMRNENSSHESDVCEE